MQEGFLPASEAWARAGQWSFERLCEGWCPHGHDRLTAVPELPGVGGCDTCCVGWKLDETGATTYLRPGPLVLAG